MSGFINDLVGKEVRIYFTVYDKAACRYDIKGEVVDCDEHFIKLQLNEKEYLIAISKIDFIEYAL